MTREKIMQLNTDYLNNCESEQEMNELFAYVLELQKHEQEPFMNKSCVAHQVCHEDKVKAFDKIISEITKEAECTMNGNRAGGLYKALQIINKCKGESEE